MGVPVVGRVGNTHAGRVGLSLLNCVGLPEWASATADEYVRTACGLAEDARSLSDLRASLRPRMRGSALMDAPQFARRLEEAYRAIWRQWCNHRNS